MLSMFGSPRKESPRSTNQHLPAELKLPNLAPRLLFVPYKENNPALAHQQMPSLTFSFLLTLVYENLSPCTTFQSSFLCARLDAAQFMNRLLGQYMFCGKFCLNR